MLTLVDVTVRKRAEEALGASQQILEAILDAGPHSIWVKSNEGRYLQVNHAFADSFNLAPEDIVGCLTQDFTVIAEEDRASIIATDRQVIDSGERMDLPEEKLMLTTGQQHVRRVTKLPLRDKHGNVVGLVGISVDITTRKEAERGQRTTQMLLQTVFDTIPHWLMVKDTDSKYLMVNKSFADSVGRDPMEFVNRNIGAFSVGSEEQRHLIQAADRQVLESGKQVHIPELKLTLPDGKERIFQDTKLPLRDETGDIVGLVSVSEDITDRKAMEKQLHQSQKMESIGTLAAGIAHDFNNILQPMIAFTELVMETIPPERKEYEYLSIVTKSIRRAKDLVSKIMLFSRHAPSRKGPCNLQTLAGETLQLLRSSLPSTISIVEEISADVSMVNGDRSQLHQVILNLGINAGQAMPEGGELRVGLENVELREVECFAGTTLSGNYVRLEVSDTGIGMDEDTMTSIFEPFFTTKEAGKGTGLGLATAYGIVQQHDGGITVSSSPGQGTTFEIFIPANQEIEEETTIFEPPIVTGREKILFIDDEETIASMAKVVLEGFGYMVTALASSTQALELFQSNPRGFDLVITDLTMPDMNGDRLAEALREIRADIPIILCTGFSETVTPEYAYAKGINAYAIKPVESKELGRMIRKVLDETMT